MAPGVFWLRRTGRSWPLFLSHSIVESMSQFLEGGSAYPFMVPILHDVVLQAARPLAVLVAVGECAIGVSLVLGVLTRWASVCGLAYMLALLFAANYPGAGSALWMYCGAALDHLVFALCFVALIVGEPQATWAMRVVRTRSSRGRHGL